MRLDWFIFYVHNLFSLIFTTFPIPESEKIHFLYFHPITQETEFISSSGPQLSLYCYHLADLFDMKNFIYRQRQLPKQHMEMLILAPSPISS